MSSKTTKNSIELRLIPTPGAKAEFLATVTPVESSTASSSSVPPIWQFMIGTSQQPTVVLEGYTRDEWASDTSTQWHSIQVQSVDGRQKLPGFTKYLRDRQKTAFGRLAATGPSSTTTYVIVISFKQASSQTLKCRVAPLETIPNCPLKPLQQSKSSSQQQQQQKSVPQQKQQQQQQQQQKAPTSNAPKRKGFGLLGNLVGAQKRTNEQVQSVSGVVEGAGSSGGGPSSTAGTLHTNGDSSTMTNGNSMEYKTPAEVIAEFRQEMEEKLLDFDISPDPVIKVTITLRSKVQQLAPADQTKVTMELLKYIVYEQAEEINEEWVAYKEPAEFLDEVTIAVYKEGEAPPEVLEEINKGELPDEIRGQQRAIQEQRQRAEQAREMKKAQELQKAAMKNDDNDDDFAALNTNKRDRRTIEEIQRGVTTVNKRSRV